MPKASSETAKTAKTAKPVNSEKPAKATKATKSNHLVRVSALDFTEGLYVGTELFVKLADNFVLLCANTTLTGELIAKINDFELTGDALYIDGDYYNSMGGRHRVAENDHSAQENRDYLSIKAAAADIFREIDRDEKVPWNHTTQLVIQIKKLLESSHAPFILQCISTVHSNDHHLHSHCVNVALLNGLMARWLHKTDAEVELLLTIGLLYDIGKLRISSAILYKSGRLTQDEFDIIKRHPVYSQEILQNSGTVDPVLLSAVRGHHEQMNGLGYPDGLSVDEIPEFARITAISDIYDAMVSKRVYREPASPFEVLEQFARDRFSHLDIQLVNIFLDRMSVELMGKMVRLSDGSVGEVLYVDRASFGYPIVGVAGKTIRTSSELRCVELLPD